MSYIKIEVPNDDHIALRAFGKALEEMALAHGAEPRKTTVGELSYKVNIDTTDATAALERLNTATDTLMQAAPRMMDELRCEGDELQGKRKEPEIDTTTPQVESLATHVITSQEKDGDPVYMGNGNISQGYHIEVEELPTTDSTGTPWDERIHSTSKALNADGTWRLRRKPKDMDEAEWSDYVTMIKADLQYPVECGGEEPTLEEAVDASIEAAHAGIAQEFGTGIANAAFTGDRNEPPVTPSGDDFHTDVGVVTEQTVASIPPIPVPPPVTSAMAAFPPYAPIPNNVPASDVWDFPGLMKFLTERHGRITVEQVNALLAVDGLAALTDLNVHPDKIGPFVARVKAHLEE